MGHDPAIVDWASECLAPLGEVTSRRMMGGATLYLDGTVFAIIGLETLWFKAEPASDPLWDAAGCERFSYTFADGRTGTMNYRRAPDDVHDDPDAMRYWASVGLQAGRRAPAKKRKPR